MSSEERVLGKQTIEIVEITTPKCANTYGQGLCTATGGTGSECYNTRATCQSVGDYQAEPLAPLTPDQTYTQGQIAANTIAGGNEYAVKVNLFVPLDPDGCVFEVGGNTASLYVGFTAGELVARCGSGAAIGNPATARVAIDATKYEGSYLTVVAVFTYEEGVSCNTKLYIYDQIELELFSVGTSTSITDPVVLVGSSALGVGTPGSLPLSSAESTEDYNGSIDVLNVYVDQGTILFNDQNAYRNKTFLGRGVLGEPDVGKPILPLIDSLSTIGTKINLSGADRNYKPIGRTASLDVSFKDQPHSGIGQDPYYKTRLDDPAVKSTFWKTWVAREKFGKVGARVRVLEGYAGQLFFDFESRGYLLEEVNLGLKSGSLYCRDELSRTELLKAQVPVSSSGSLAVDMDEVQTSFDMDGDFTDEYAQTGSVRINDEIMDYTSVSYSEPFTTFSGITRSTFGSSVSAHSENDKVQRCERISGDVESVITDLLVRRAKVPPQLIDLEGLNNEQISYLEAYNLDTLLSEVDGVETVIGWVVMETGTYIWWDERSQQIRLKAIRALSPADVVLEITEENNLVENTFRYKEKPRQRLNSVTTYFGPKDFAGKLDEVANFSSGVRVLNGENSGSDQYGNVLQALTMFSRFLGTEAEVAQTTQRLANRYEDIPVEAMFSLDAKDKSLWTGDIVSISTKAIVDEDGNRILKRWLVIDADPIIPGHRYEYTVVDVTLDGLIYSIADNAVGDYNIEDARLGIGFITNNEGFNPDGTRGASIT